MSIRMENIAHSLDVIAGACARHGLLCALENKLPHLMFGNTAEMLWILAAMQSPNVAVCLDTGHARLAGELETAVQKLSGHLRLVHASDNHGQYDDHLPPGRGSINWPHFLELLATSQFSGSIMLEIAPRGEMEATLEAARQAREYLRKEAWKLAARSAGAPA
jgi:sugar phosphate isomerase/epimerase